MDGLPRSAPRRAHPELPELAGGLRLSVDRLRQRPDAHKLETFIRMLANAEYWLSFDLYAFEPSMATAPSPLRELGVAVALKFGEGVDGRLTRADLASARTFVIRRIAPDMRAGVTEALDRLEAVIDARDREDEWRAEGFTAYAPAPALSVHALRAMSQAKIVVDGRADGPKQLELAVGQPVQLASVDDRQRPLDPPEVETDTGAPILVRDADRRRDVIFMVPGAYRLRVPGRASSEKKVSVV